MCWKDIPASLHNLGYTELALGNVERAQDLFTEALNMQIELGNKQGMLECLSGLAGVAGAKRDPHQAARLFGFVIATLEQYGVPMWPAERADFDRNLASARAQLDEAAWEKAWQEGRGLNLDQAIEESRTLSPQPPLP